MISLDRGIAGLAVLEDLGVIDAPDLDIEPVGAGEIDIPVPEGDIPGEKIDILLGKRSERAMAGDDPGPVEYAALGLEQGASGPN
ncbi:MAG: hypothetical protein MUE80_02040 [Acidobacteria bacterium]|nr:hypothetical protein [Acidobacteriota bacterium]